MKKRNEEIFSTFKPFKKNKTTANYETKTYDEWLNGMINGHGSYEKAKKAAIANYKFFVEFGANFDCCSDMQYLKRFAEALD